MGRIFNKSLDKNKKQEGLLKRLKNIEDKANNQLQLIIAQERVQNAIDNQPVEVKKIDKKLKPDWMYRPNSLNQLMIEINNSKKYTIINGTTVALTILKNFLKDVIGHKFKNEKEVEKNIFRNCL